MADITAPKPRPADLFRENGHDLIATDRVIDKLGPIAERMIPEVAQVDVVLVDDQDAGPELVAANGGQGAYTLGIAADLDKDGKPEAGFIHIPDLDRTPEQYAGALAGIDPTRVHDVPGTAADYTLATAFHEACHIPQNTEPVNGFDPTGMPNEIGADNCSFENLERASAEGHTVDPKTVQEITYDARIVGSLGVQDVNGDAGMPASHSTHLRLDAPNALPEHAGGSVAAMVNVNRQFNALTGDYMRYEAESKIIAETDPGIKAEIAENYQLQAMLDDKDTRSRLGAEAATTDPALAQAALNTLRDKGYIQDGTPEAAYADRIRDFYDKHVDTSQPDATRAQLTENYMNAVPQAPMYTPAPTQQPAAPTTAAPSQTMRGMEF